MLFPPNDTAGAIFSDCRRYRYRLWRVWDASKPAVAFCMLNPSTADEDILDPTVTRCVGFAKSWGYGRLDVVNLFALRSTDPSQLKKVTCILSNDVGEFSKSWPKSELVNGEFAINLEDNQVKNLVHIEAAYKESVLFVCAWGTDGKLNENQGENLKCAFLQSKCKIYHLGLNKDGSPKHPLYLKSDLKPILWE